MCDETGGVWMLTRGKREKLGHTVLCWGVSSCVNPQTDGEGHVCVWMHNNGMNKSFSPPFDTDKESKLV